MKSVLAVAAVLLLGAASVLAVPAVKNQHPDWGLWEYGVVSPSPDSSAWGFDSGGTDTSQIYPIYPNSYIRSQHTMSAANDTLDIVLQVSLDGFNWVRIDSVLGVVNSYQQKAWYANTVSGAEFQQFPVMATFIRFIGTMRASSGGAGITTGAFILVPAK